MRSTRLFPVAAIWNDRLGSALIQFLAQFGAVVCLVAQHPFRRLHSADQALRDRAIMRFAFQSTSFSICECVYPEVHTRAGNRTSDCTASQQTVLLRSLTGLVPRSSSSSRNSALSYALSPSTPSSQQALASASACIRRSILGRAIAPAAPATVLLRSRLYCFAASPACFRAHPVPRAIRRCRMPCRPARLPVNKL